MTRLTLTDILEHIVLEALEEWENLDESKKKKDAPKKDDDKKKKSDKKASVKWTVKLADDPSTVDKSKSKATVSRAKSKSKKDK